MGCGREREREREREGEREGEREREREGEREGEVPLLNFVEAGEERDGDEDDDCFFAVADLELFDLGEFG